MSKVYLSSGINSFSGPVRDPKNISNNSPKQEDPNPDKITFLWSCGRTEIWRSGAKSRDGGTDVQSLDGAADAPSTDGGSDVTDVQPTEDYWGGDLEEMSNASTFQEVPSFTTITYREKSSNKGVLLVFVAKEDSSKLLRMYVNPLIDGISFYAGDVYILNLRDGSLHTIYTPWGGGVGKTFLPQDLAYLEIIEHMLELTNLALENEPDPVKKENFQSVASYLEMIVNRISAGDIPEEN